MSPHGVVRDETVFSSGEGMAITLQYGEGKGSDFHSTGNIRETKYEFFNLMHKALIRSFCAIYLQC